MAKVLYNMAVVTGSYVDSTGATKKKYQTIGVVFEGEGGSQFAVMDRSFNPAGVPYDPSKGNSVVVSLFPPRDQTFGPYAGKQSGGGKPGGKDLAGEIPEESVFKGDIPF